MAVQLRLLMKAALPNWEQASHFIVLGWRCGEGTLNHNREIPEANVALLLNGPGDLLKDEGRPRYSAHFWPQSFLIRLALRNTEPTAA